MAFHWTVANTNAMMQTCSLKRFVSFSLHFSLIMSLPQFMLLANQTVAQQIAFSLPEQALLRRHEEPIERRMVITLQF